MLTTQTSRVAASTASQGQGLLGRFGTGRPGSSGTPSDLGPAAQGTDVSAGSSIGGMDRWRRWAIVAVGAVMLSLTPLVVSDLRLLVLLVTTGAILSTLGDFKKTLAVKKIRYRSVGIALHCPGC